MGNRKSIEDRRRCYPACCDIYKDGDDMVLRMEMPGVSKDNLEIRVDGDRLIVDAKKQLEDLKGIYKIREIKDGDYHHEFTIDDTIDRNKIDATVKNGILHLKLGVKESVKVRKIEIKTM